MAEILYNEEKHEYTLDGEIVPSVTELAQQFTGMDTTWFKAHPQYAEAGTEAHNELAAYYEQDSTMTKDDFQNEKARTMCEWLNRDKYIQPEVLVYNTKYKYAGTADIVSIVDGKCTAVVDWKTGEHINKLYCRCQLSLYLLALKDMGVDTTCANLIVITPNGPYYFEPFSWEEMKNLLADYSPDNQLAKQISELEAQMASLAYAVQEYEDAKQKLKELLSKGFEDTKTRKYNGEHFTFAYIPSTTRKSLDQKKVAEALGDLDEYMKESSVSATVRIKEI